MKAKRIELEEVKKFEPITLQITLETEAELQNFYQRNAIEFDTLEKGLAMDVTGEDGDTDDLFDLLDDIMGTVGVERFR